MVKRIDMHSSVLWRSLVVFQTFDAMQSPVEVHLCDVMLTNAAIITAVREIVAEISFQASDFHTGSETKIFVWREY
eukprot:g72979.t1